VHALQTSLVCSRKRHASQAIPPLGSKVLHVATSASSFCIIVAAGD
jgi:hypothetical protein